MSGNARIGSTVIGSPSGRSPTSRVLQVRLRPAVDLGAARAALRGLAVPADGEVGRVVGLDPVERRRGRPSPPRPARRTRRTCPPSSGVAAEDARAWASAIRSLLRLEQRCGARRASWAAASSRPPCRRRRAGRRLFFVAPLSAELRDGRAGCGRRASPRAGRALRAIASAHDEHVADLEDEVPAGVEGATARRRGRSASGARIASSSLDRVVEIGLGPEDPDVALHRRLELLVEAVRVSASAPLAPNGASSSAAAAWTAAGSTTARRRGSPRTPPRPAPARWPNTSRSDSELPPSRFAPCIPPAHLARGEQPRDAVVAPVSASTRMPPMM